MNVVKEILIEEGYSSAESLAKDISVLFALSKAEQYRSECELFEKKYGVSLNEFEKTLHSQKGIEVFEKEEDLEDWEFSANALKWWEEKVKEIRSD